MCDPVPLRALAEQLATEAAVFVRRRRGEVFGSAPADGAVRTKSSPTDPVTIVDTETEALLRARLTALRPGDLVLGEEGGGPDPIASADADAATVTWALDPIDGTVNFVYGIPAYAVSVAARIGGVSVAGAVANVVTGEVFSAGLGLGAEVIDAAGRRSIATSAATELAMALVGTGFSYHPALRAAQAQLLTGLLPAVRDIRRMGSAALDLCMLAAGRLDALYEHDLHVWDWAAGALIAAEAGATVWLPADDDDAGAPLLMAAAPGVAGAFHAELARLGALGSLTA